MTEIFDFITGLWSHSPVCRFLTSCCLLSHIREKFNGYLRRASTIVLFHISILQFSAAALRVIHESLFPPYRLSPKNCMGNRSGHTYSASFYFIHHHLSRRRRERGRVNPRLRFRISRGLVAEPRAQPPPGVLFRILLLRRAAQLSRPPKDDREPRKPEGVRPLQQCRTIWFHFNFPPRLGRLPLQVSKHA